MIEVSCAGEKLLLHPERAVLWPAAATVFVADLHLGKAEIFRRSGIAIPEGTTDVDLARLERLALENSVTRVVVLGDFLHGPSAIVSTHAAAFRRWRRASAIDDFIVVAGNHDRRSAGLELSDVVEWRHENWQAGPFVCRHHPDSSTLGYVLSGHVHPTVQMRSRLRERMRFPVCWFRAGHAILPAFGSFTGGMDIEPESGDTLYAFAANRVWRIPQ